MISVARAERQVVTLITSVVVVTPLGLATKFYHGPAAGWVNNSLGGVLYVVFWCLVAQLAARRARPVLVVTIVLTVTSVLEALQLWHPPALQAVRHTFLGAALLGTTFVWSDFPHYMAGAALAWGWLAFVRRISDQPQPPRTRPPTQ